MISKNYVDGLEIRITELQQRNAELELLLQTAEQNAAEQRDMKAKAREQRDEQVKKNAELAAQVEQLRLAALNAISFMSGGEAKADLRDAYDSTPEQCLAEVKAQAVMDFVGFVYSQFENGEYQAVARRKYHALNSRAQGQTVSIHNDAEYCGIIGNAEVYANQIRQQAKGGES